MSPEAWPEPVPFDPEAGTLPPALDSALADPDPAILLLVAPGPDDAVARAAIGLAEARSRRGLRTVLADASTGRPALHRHLGVQNLEGLADLFLFGASLEHVRVRPEGRRFDFIPPGAYAPDPAAVLSSDRWARVRRELEDEGARMLLVVPADAPGLGILSQRLGEVVLIGDAEAADGILPRLHRTCRVAAVITPTPPPEPAAIAAEGPGEPEMEPNASTAIEPEAQAEPDLSEPAVFRTHRRGTRRVSPVLLVLLAAALLVVAWLVYRTAGASSATPSPAPAQEAAQEPAREATPAPTEPIRRGPIETPLEIAVQVEAHQDQALAEQRVALLRAAEPDLNFYVAPISAQGVVYYRVLAGPVEDPEAGERVMERLVEAGHKSAMDDWAVRPSGLAFLLGEFDTRGAARARMRDLGERGVPAYVIPLHFEEGPPRYRVWGGGFQYEREAEVMRGMLEDAGVEAPLVARTGAPIAEGS
jgi:hypothetical protein